MRKGVIGWSCINKYLLIFITFYFNFIFLGFWGFGVLGFWCFYNMRFAFWAVWGCFVWRALTYAA
jgi:hypothetical protein